jgi:Phytanoyl-CoA hydroxylase-interacting protein C-terminus
MLDLAPNCYFVDFYCMNGSTHYVTLVMTSPGSAADEFCLSHGLPQLDINDGQSNPFICRFNDGTYVNVAPRLQIELFFTETVDVRSLLRRAGACMTSVRTVGRGSSTPGGIPKNSACPICNLPRPTRSHR